MTKKETINLFFSYLDKIFPNVSCELNYKKDYELLIAVMLSAQTTDKSVNFVTDVLFSKYDTLEKLNNASLLDIENIIKKIGLYKNKAKNLKEIVSILLNKYDGVVPHQKEELVTLPGVGIKTAGVVRAELFKIPEFPVDTHVERVSKRLGLVNQSDTPNVIETKLKKLTPKERHIKSHHQFIHFGRYFCTAKKPNCDKCEMKHVCKKPII